MPAVQGTSAAVVDAHEEAKQALAELRDFIRGLHPAVLDELGLDAALSGIAARSTVPVRLAVDLGTRPPAAVEAVAYFVVSEALTNVVRHAAASHVDVCVHQQPGRLVLSIVDDGRAGRTRHAVPACSGCATAWSRSTVPGGSRARPAGPPRSW
jgi:signal transduction histidine kinase